MRHRAFASPLLLLLLVLGWPAPFARAADADVSGRWTGTWYGQGIFSIPREQIARAELRQPGAGGSGRLVLEDAGAAESVPLELRLAGSTGVRVVFTATPTGLLMWEPDGAFAIDFVRRGDALVGRVRDASPDVTIVLRRAPVPTAGAAAPPAVPPGPVAGPAPTPPSAPGPSAAAPTPAMPAPPTGATRPPVPAFVETAALQPIHFDFDQAAIRPDAAGILDTNAVWLRAHANVDVLIEGHCDERGTNEYNLALGERRARAARDYLVARGVAATRLATISYGEERPVCAEHTEACWAENRRAVFRVRAE